MGQGGVREDSETMSVGDRNIHDTGNRNTLEYRRRQVIGSGLWKFEVGMFSWKHRSRPLLNTDVHWELIHREWDLKSERSLR